jgi:hypothetical protein
MIPTINIIIIFIIVIAFIIIELAILGQFSFISSYKVDRNLIKELIERTKSRKIKWKETTNHLGYAWETYYKDYRIICVVNYFRGEFGGDAYFIDIYAPISLFQTSPFLLKKISTGHKLRIKELQRILFNFENFGQIYDKSALEKYNQTFKKAASGGL